MSKKIEKGNPVAGIFSVHQQQIKWICDIKNADI